MIVPWFVPFLPPCPPGDVSSLAELHYDSWKSARGSTEGSTFTLSIVALGGNRNTGGDAYDTLGAATCGTLGPGDGLVRLLPGTFKKPRPTLSRRRSKKRRTMPAQ
jgi:hypothetical protein